MKPFAAIVALGILVAACSSSSNKTRAASPSSSVTTASSAASTSSTVPPASTCGAAPATGKSGGGDVAPPGDIPDNQAFVAFAPPGGRYSIKVPEGWARTDAASVTSFTDKLNTIRIELKPSASAPSAQSAQVEDVPALQAQSRCFEAPKVSTVQRPAGTAVLVTYRADSTPDPVTGKVIHDDVERYEFWKGGTEAVVTLSSPQGSDNVDPWRTVTTSFTWTA